jgi:hypothetical protein
MINSNKCILDSTEILSNKTLNTFLELNLLPIHSIGLPKELSLMLKTKDHADHVGLSLPPDLLKELINSKTKNCYLSLNNN